MKLASLALLLISLALCKKVVECAPQPTARSTQPSCSCNWGSVWNDVMYLFDQSTWTTDIGLNELLEHVQTDVVWYTLSKSDDVDAPQVLHAGFNVSAKFMQMSMRTGIVVYDSNATTMYPLGSLNNEDFIKIEALPSSNSTRTNLASAFQAAVAEFSGRNHRENSRKVIVVLASKFSQDDEADDPRFAAKSFKSSGGIVVVYNYLYGNKWPDEILEDVASPNYFITNQDDINGTFMRDAQCDANCFCLADQESFRTEDARNTPLEGCYNSIAVSSNFRLASRRCQQFNNGSLTIIESKAKFQFVRQTFSNPNNFWIGLKYDPLSQIFRWLDGSTLGSYQPWAAGQPNTSATEQCVYSPLSFDWNALNWALSECRTSYAFVCEAPPCDSAHFCYQPTAGLAA